jgi:hypothetical protein
MVVQVLVGVELDGSVITSAHSGSLSGHWDKHGVTWITWCTLCVHNLTFGFH